jgi:hypothetical protein
MTRQATIGLMLIGFATLVVAIGGRNYLRRAKHRGAVEDTAEQRAELVAELESDFRAEARDPKWSDHGTTEASRALAHDLPEGTKLGKVECRSTMCRVESSHTSVDAFQAFVRADLLSHTRQLWNGGFSSYVVSQSPTGVTALTFIARESTPESAAKSALN